MHPHLPKSAKGLRFHRFPVAGALVLCMFAAGASAPGPSAAAEPAIPLKLPADIVYTRGIGADSAVIFRHGSHFDYASRRCIACHPKPFRMLTPTHHVSHADMNAGRACGTCHDGEHAFAVADSSSCGTCHTGRPRPALSAANSGVPAPSGPPQRKLPAALTFVRGEASPGTVTFRHETHVRSTIGCATCHPKLYAMKKTGGAPAGAMHETNSCGACHDGRHAFDLTDGDACERCHAAQEAKP